MEIDVKKEQKRVQGEMEEITKGVNQITSQENQFAQQKQLLINDLIKKQGELEYLNRVNGDKSGKSEKAD